MKISVMSDFHLILFKMLICYNLNSIPKSQPNRKNSGIFSIISFSFQYN